MSFHQDAIYEDTDSADTVAHSLECREEAQNSLAWEAAAAEIAQNVLEALPSGDFSDAMKQSLNLSDIQMTFQEIREISDRIEAMDELIEKIENTGNLTRKDLSILDQRAKLKLVLKAKCVEMCVVGTPTALTPPKESTGFEFEGISGKNSNEMMAKKAAEVAQRLTELKIEIREEIEKEREKILSNDLKNRAIVSALFATAQGFQLLANFDLIKDGQNFTETSMKKLEKIERRVDEIKNETCQVVTCMADFQNLYNRWRDRGQGQGQDQNEVSEFQVEEMSTNLKSKTKCLKKICKKTRKMIKKLEVNINGKIVEIGSYRKEMLKGGFVTFIKLAEVATTFYHMYHRLNRNQIILQGVQVATFLGLCFGNARGYWITGDILENLQESTNKLKDLKKTLKSHMVKIKRAGKVCM